MRNSTLGSFAAAGALSLSASASVSIPSSATPGPGEPTRRRQSPRGTIRANVGRNHPDYGQTVEQHAANKLARTGRAY